MKKITTILIATALILLFIGTASAFEVKDLKPIEDYTAFDNSGYSNYTTNSDRFFCVEKIYSLNSNFIDEWFNNHTEVNYLVVPMGDNIFYFEDEDFEFYGYQEVVSIDGDNYMVSINQKSKLSPSEKNEFLEDLKEFNKVNSLELVSVT